MKIWIHIKAKVLFFILHKIKQKILRYFWLSDYVKQICGINPVNSFVDVRIGTVFFTSYLFVLLLSTTLRIKVNLIYLSDSCSPAMI